MNPTFVRQSFGLMMYSPSSGNVSWKAFRPGTERQAVDVARLRQVEADAVGLVGGGRRVADRQRADCSAAPM